MKNIDSIIKEGVKIEGYKMLDVNYEWDRFMDAIGEQPNTPPIIDIKKQKSTRIQNILGSLAAVTILVLFVIFTLKPVEKTRKTITASNDDQKIELIDGSVITLNQGAVLDYPLTFEGQSQRKVILSGDASFNVTRSVLPFIVEYANKLRVEVIGTQFVLSMNGDDIVIENIQGRFYIADINAPNDKIIVSEGDKFQYSNDGFLDLNKPVEDLSDLGILEDLDEDNEEELAVSNNESIYKLGSVLKDFIIKYNKKKIKIDKKFKYDSDQEVLLNLAQPTEQILEKLQSHGIIDLKPGKCEGCLIIIAPEK